MQVKLKDIKANPSNPRTIRDEKFTKLVKSIADFPEMLFKRPLVCVTDTDGMLYPLGGNMRLKAFPEALKLMNGKAKLFKDGLPVELADEWTEEQRREFVIKDNVGFGEWDWEMIANEWDAEQVTEWGLDIPDFAVKELEAEEDDYEIPDTIETDIVLGDLFEIGPHRLLCGSSTEADAVAKLLNGKEPYLMVTDPPYGVVYDAAWRNEAAAEGLIGQKKSTRAIGKVMNDDKADWTEAWALSPAKVAYVYHSGIYSGTVQKSLEDCDFIIRSQIIWAKNNFAISRGDYHWKHEPCWYAVKKGSKGNWAGDRSQTTVWNIDKPMKSETGHSTQKPVECMARAIGNHDGDVYEPFNGSGTTMVAGHQLGRKVYAMELNPEYVQICVDRMLKLDPTLEIKRNGQPYKTEIKQ